MRETLFAPGDIPLPAAPILPAFIRIEACVDKRDGARRASADPCAHDQCAVSPGTDGADSGPAPS